MNKKLIIVENGNYIEFDTKEELVKKLLGEDYYKLSKADQNERIKSRTIFNSIGYKRLYTNKMYANDETIYIYWLLLNTNIFLLERNDSYLFTKGIKRDKNTKGYIIVNRFAKELLDNYIKEVGNNYE